MTSDWDFVAEIRTHWMDDEPRLKFAEWLTKHYRTQAADFVRVQCEWDQLDPEDPRFLELSQREFQLRESLSSHWLDQVSDLPGEVMKSEWNRCVADASCMSEPTGRKRARRVARGLMRRVRSNVKHLVRRLREIGYRFTFPESASVRVSSEQFDRIVEFQRQKRWTFPVSLTAFLLEVGSVNLMGTHPQWPFTAYYFDDIERSMPYCLTDPLVVDATALVNLLPFEFKEIGKDLRIEVAPDDHHKSRVSGCGCQAVIFKRNAVEATIEDGGRGRPDREFVAFLENAFAWCGFPGFAFAKDPPTGFIDEHLRPGLIPIFAIVR
jgi:uncharacterized protein (TIGR02996 family)